MSDTARWGHPAVFWTTCTCVPVGAASGRPQNVWYGDVWATTGRSYDKALNTFIIPNSILGEKSQITEMNGFLLYNMQLKKSRKTLDVVQYWWYYNNTEKIKANTKGKVKQGFYSKRRKPSSNLKDVNPVWYPRKRWVQWYQKRHLTSSRDSPRRCDRNDQGDSWKNERVPIPQIEPPEKRDRLLSKGNNNGNFGEAILVNLTIRTWHTKTVKRIEAAGK